MTSLIPFVSRTCAPCPNAEQHNAFHRPVGASGLTQVIEPAERRHPRGDLGLVRQRGAARHELVTAQPQADRVVRSHRGADGGNDLEQEAEPVLEVSAVVVSSGVGRGRQELVDEVAVRAVDLDSPKPSSRIRAAASP